MNEILDHIKDIKRFINTEKEMNDYSKNRIVEAFYSGKLHEVLPPAVYEDVLTFISKQLAEGSDKVLIGLKTKGESAVVFKYSIEPDSNGYKLHLDEFSLPTKPYTIDFPEATTGKCLLIDVSAID
jgi:hypothetical protein